ncbi:MULTISPECIES: PDR/VanB family oxidoreductase [unclassified Rhodococcus (in: high G+C Gram-positive bacteria)]|jgi:ferredoxin-NADP reductase|uniref:PDR/VanB family oxidoreductase n=1 Tax=unclassified Rhodococcus (in: high G+C Gram-positive bacteria) TaxID=192944 RepID=UPI00131F4B4B|nr:MULTISPECIES: PDR/VanB family oxidoreductase [unclassified Rhodococcus (in: high G+C Gram-positive bacteria)]QHE70311.1 Flavodoxin reductases (ferredoxin-NADPH reductases) family 1 [Rhodococcus sp. WAY2]
MAVSGRDEAHLHLRVRRRDAVAEGVVVLELENSTSAPLPPWDPGAHIDLCLPNGMTRQYSLCGTPSDNGTYRVGILRDPASRGGSSYIVDEVGVGAAIEVKGPRNHFHMLPSPRYVFIAGGIGITPLLPMISAAEASGAEWELHYGGRSRQSMGFLDEITTLSGDRVRLYPEDEVGLIDLATVLDGHRAETLVYTCGPSGLLQAIEERTAGWPVGSVHMERFEPKEFDQETSTGSFEVELSDSGTVLVVPPDRSVLQVLQDADVDVYSSCQDGTCGTCETTVLAGEVEHRDSILSAEEQAANDRMYICVSRAACPRLVLEL